MITEKLQGKKSEHEKLWDMLYAYEKILHPDLFNGLKNRLQAAYDENKKDAFANAKISDEALAIEEMVKTCRERIDRQTFPKGFALKCLYKDLLKFFK